MGKPVKVKFQVADSKEEWFLGTIVSYNSMSGEYGVFFPCDKKTVRVVIY